jgi:hypothetical protein
MAQVTGRKPGIKTIDRDGSPDPKQPPSSPPPRLALSILEFCAAFGLSEDFFYKLKRQGQAPRLMRVGSRTLISMEAADEWRKAREAASTATAETTA